MKSNIWHYKNFYYNEESLLEEVEIYVALQSLQLKNTGVAEVSRKDGISLYLITNEEDLTGLSEVLENLEFEECTKPEFSLLAKPVNFFGLIFGN